MPQTCVNGFNVAADKGAQVAAALPGTASYGPNDDASMTYKAYVDFASAHVNLFNILSSRAGQFLLPAPLVAKPVVASLLRVQAIIDVCNHVHVLPSCKSKSNMGADVLTVISQGVSSFLINTVNPSPAKFQSQLTPLDAALNTCIAKWKKACGSFC
jgi:hypothetical protein